MTMDQHEHERHEHERHEHYFLLEAEPRGGHVHVSVRAGSRRHARALCGSLIMDPGEWVAFRSMLERGSQGEVGHDWHLLLEVQVRDPADGG